jgi:Reverse transcriptase (RNA-dependent DNA polymerase).
VKVGTNYSNQIDINCGLIQGAVISPILFNLYVNDIHDIGLKTNILQYADDTLLYYINEDINIAKNNIQEDLNRIIIWLNQKDIFINKEKQSPLYLKTP